MRNGDFIAVGTVDFTDEEMSLTKTFLIVSVFILIRVTKHIRVKRLLLH